MISKHVLDAVDAGIEWADENIQDWRKYVDPAKLDMKMGDTCFLGQYWNNSQNRNSSDTGFSEAFRAFFQGDWIRVEQLGFVAYNTTYTELNAAWQQKFKELDDKS